MRVDDVPKFLVPFLSFWAGDRDGKAHIREPRAHVFVQPEETTSVQVALRRDVDFVDVNAKCLSV
jgi:hypothetical protein